MKSLKSIVLGLSMAALVGCASVPKHSGPYNFKGQIVEENLVSTSLGSLYLATIVDSAGKKEQVSRFFADPEGAKKLDEKINVGDYVEVEIDTKQPKFEDYKFGYNFKKVK